VLDEADRLLDQGFRRDLVKIIEALPSPAQSPRQTLLFSATIPSEVHSVRMRQCVSAKLTTDRFAGSQGQPQVRLNPF
jgi:superfamily II DNA/RNA helicase